MKKIFISILAVIAATAIYAEGENERLYINSNCIYATTDGIFLNIDGELYGITSLEADENGVYVPTPSAGYCGKHGPYPGSSTVCPYCLAEKKRKK